MKKKKLDSIFSYDSPMMLIGSKIAGLIILNLLWLLCCLPVITIGPSTTAMHDVLIQQRLGKTDLVVKPFFHSFRRNFRASLGLGLLVALLFVILIFDGLFVYAATPKGFNPLWIPFGIMLLINGALMLYGFPMMARYEIRFRTLVRNCIGFLLNNPVFSLQGMLLIYLPVILLLFFPDFFRRITFLLVLFCGSVPGAINCKPVLDLFANAQEDE